MAVDKLLLTTTEAAHALGICRSKLYELLRAGRLESVRIDGSRRVPAAVLEEFVSRLRSGAANS
jgi:excisionase family DNA binding protein